MGKLFFGFDYKREGMLFVMIEYFLVFGLKVVDFNIEEIKVMVGVKDVFIIDMIIFELGGLGINVFF